MTRRERYGKTARPRFDDSPRDSHYYRIRSVASSLLHRRVDDGCGGGGSRARTHYHYYYYSFALLPLPLRLPLLPYTVVAYPPDGARVPFSRTSDNRRASRPFDLFAHLPTDRPPDRPYVVAVIIDIDFTMTNTRGGRKSPVVVVLEPSAVAAAAAK